MTRVPRRLPWTALLIALLATGCTDSSRVRKVTGKVTLDDVALAGADVQFVPASPEDLHQGTFGNLGKGTDAEGKFEIVLGPATGMNAQPGRFKVLVTKGSSNAAPPPGELNEEDFIKAKMKVGPGADPKAGPKGNPSSNRNSLPPIYAEPRTSPFTFDVTDGDNDVGTLKLKKQ